jgi:hypothetical protein
VRGWAKCRAPGVVQGWGRGGEAVEVTRDPRPAQTLDGSRLAVRVSRVPRSAERGARSADVRGATFGCWSGARRTARRS